MITNEQAVEYAKKLKEFCAEQENCYGCQFETTYECKVAEDGLAPEEWQLDD